MAEITKYLPGTFCWTDLATKDVAAAKRFYENIFGWKSQDLPVRKGESMYTLFQVGEKNVCALYPMTEDQKQKKMPPSWLAYVSVDSVDDTIIKSKSAGATVIAEAMNVMEAGRMAILKDPSDAVFAIWQANKHIGAEINESIGTVCWRELMVPNLDVAGKFYSTVFGWQAKASDKGISKYLIFSKREEPVAGMMLPPMKNIPPHWLTYWVVRNCEQTANKTKQLGGQVIKESTEIPDMGRFAVLSDPEGAPFGVMEYNE